MDITGTGWLSALAIVVAFVMVIYLFGMSSRREKRPKSPDALQKDSDAAPSRRSNVKERRTP